MSAQGCVQAGAHAGRGSCRQGRTRLTVNGKTHWPKEIASALFPVMMAVNMECASSSVVRNVMR